MEGADDMLAPEEGLNEEPGTLTTRVSLQEVCVDHIMLCNVMSTCGMHSTCRQVATSNASPQAKPPKCACCMKAMSPATFSGKRTLPIAGFCVRVLLVLQVPKVVKKAGWALRSVLKGVCIISVLSQTYAQRFNTHTLEMMCLEAAIANFTSSEYTNTGLLHPVRASVPTNQPVTDNSCRMITAQRMLMCTHCALHLAVLHLQCL